MQRNFKSVIDEMYADLIDLGYEQIKNNGFKWPDDVPLDDEERAEFLQEMLNFYKGLEEFEKCEAIHQMQLKNK